VSGEGKKVQEMDINEVETNEIKINRDAQDKINEVPELIQTTYIWLLASGS
jgi:hypothetical protein